MAAAHLADIIGIEPLNSRPKSKSYYITSKIVNMLLPEAIRSYILCVMALKGTYSVVSLIKSLFLLHKTSSKKKKKKSGK